MNSISGTNITRVMPRARRAENMVAAFKLGYGLFWGMVAALASLILLVLAVLILGSLLSAAKLAWGQWRDGLWPIL